MLSSLSARFGRYGWLLVAGGGLLALALLALVMRRRWRPSSTGVVADALRRAHEADVKLQIRKRDLEVEAEEELAEIRSELAAETSEIEVREIDRKAKLAEDGDELLAVYRRRAVELGLRDHRQRRLSP